MSTISYPATEILHGPIEGVLDFNEYIIEDSCKSSTYTDEYPDTDSTLSLSVYENHTEEPCYENRVLTIPEVPSLVPKRILRYNGESIKAPLLFNDMHTHYWGCKLLMEGKYYTLVGEKIDVIGCLGIPKQNVSFKMEISHIITPIRRICSDKDENKNHSTKICEESQSINQIGIHQGHLKLLNIQMNINRYRKR